MFDQRSLDLDWLTPCQNHQNPWSLIFIFDPYSCIIITRRSIPMSFGHSFHIRSFPVTADILIMVLTDCDPLGRAKCTHVSWLYNHNWQVLHTATIYNLQSSYICNVGRCLSWSLANSFCLLLLLLVVLLLVVLLLVVLEYGAVQPKIIAKCTFQNVEFGTF